MYSKSGTAQYIYGLPLVMSYVANYQFWLDQDSSQYKCPMNQLNHERRTFTDKDTAVIVLNSETPCSFACLDLRAEPFLFTVPEIGKDRYYSVQLCDWNIFWSVTMDDGKTKLLVANPINRFLINSPMLGGLAKNADGSLTLYLQQDQPGPDRESNWLPAPDGPVYLVMRLDWPKTESPSILPPGEGTWAPPAIRKVN